MIQLASKKDKKLILPFLIEFFDKNENINFLVKNDIKKKERLEKLANYIFNLAIAWKGLYWIGENKEGFAILHDSNAKINFFKKLYWDFCLAYQVIGFSRIPEVLKRQKKIQMIRKKNTGDKAYIYFYALGIKKEARGWENAKSPIQQVRGLVNKLITEEKKPIYVETVNPRNKLVYEHAGFTVYDHFLQEKENFTTWFLKKEK